VAIVPSTASAAVAVEVGVAVAVLGAVAEPTAAAVVGDVAMSASAAKQGVGFVAFESTHSFFWINGNRSGSSVDVVVDGAVGVVVGGNGSRSGIVTGTNRLFVESMLLERINHGYLFVTQRNTITTSR
jgi:hypothetical protein